MNKNGKVLNLKINIFTKRTNHELKPPSPLPPTYIDLLPKFMNIFGII